MFPTGSQRPKERGRNHAKTIDRCRIAIRLEIRNMGITDSDIADHIGLKPARYAMLKRTKIYQTLRRQALTGITSSLEQDISENYDINRERLNSGVPVALEGLLALAAQNDDKSIKLKAATEILDRHGYYAKVTRIGTPTKEQGASADKSDQDVANELIAAQQKNGENVEKQVDIDSPGPDKIM
jgi:hypothetical protein